MSADGRELAAVFAGGVAGALARAGLANAFPPVGGQWPWVTFAVNVAGAFALGCVATGMRPSWIARPLLGAGFCGALTTFSTVQIELLRMLDAGRAGLAAGYAAASVAAGLAAVAVASTALRRFGAVG